jgi:hypothetical protein
MDGRRRNRSAEEMAIRVKRSWSRTADSAFGWLGSERSKCPMRAGDGGNDMFGSRFCKRNLPGLASRTGRFSFSKSSGPDSHRQKQPVFMQHLLKRFPDPHGQRSFLPSFSDNSLVRWTMRTPRFTFFSDGKPLRRLLVVSKKMPGLRVPACP